MDECCLEEQERGNMDYHNYNVPLSSITVQIVRDWGEICLFLLVGEFLGKWELGIGIWKLGFRKEHIAMASTVQQGG